MLLNKIFVHFTLLKIEVLPVICLTNGWWECTLYIEVYIVSCFFHYSLMHSELLAVKRLAGTEWSSGSGSKLSNCFLNWLVVAIFLLKLTKAYRRPWVDQITGHLCIFLVDPFALFLLWRIVQTRLGQEELVVGLSCHLLFFGLLNRLLLRPKNL